IRYFPELGVGYVMLLNSVYSFRGYFEIRALLFSYLTKGRTFAAAAAAPAERPAADYFAFASPHREVFSFIDQAVMGWHVSDDADGLHLEELSGKSADLVPAGDGGYRLAFECGSSIRFTKNADGTAVMLMSYLYAESASGSFARIRYVALK